ncbi:MAG: heavy metal translocating P-type ATPase [Acidobacteriota bacterium]|nr:heavy metal translocating P-type ATPase [Acidobacteriota bacterium]
MSRTKLRLQLDLLLPDAPGAADACVGRLTQLLAAEDGISGVHVLTRPKAVAPMLCLHFDPGVLSVGRLRNRAIAAGAQLGERYGHVTVPIHLVGAEDAGGRVEDALRNLSGVLDAAVNLAAQQARIEFDRTATTAEAVIASVARLGYGAPPVAALSARTDGTGDAPTGAWYSRNQELAWSLCAGLLLVAGVVGERWFGLPSAVAIALYLGAYAFGGFDLVRHALGSITKGGFRFDIDLLMLVAAVGAAALGEWAEGAFLLFLFALAHALEHYALDRARGAIRALGELAPRFARIIRDGKEEQVAVEQVKAGTVVLVRPAERIPVDGTVLKGQSAVNQAPITGESVPVDKAAGAEVFAGTVNGDGALEITTTRAVGDRTLDRIVTLVAEAQTQKAPTQLFADRFERVFVPLVLIADVLLIVIPPLMGWWTWPVSFYRGMAMLVAATPCALALGTPAAILAGIAQAARHGVLIKGGAHLENLGITKALAFDKTGTLTIGRPEVTDVVNFEVPTDELLRIAAAVEQKSQHPLAEAIVRHASGQGLVWPAAGELESLTARGVRSSVAGVRVEIGALRLWEELGVEIPGPVRQEVKRLQAAGRSTVVVRHNTQFIGVIGIADRPREGVRAILDRLRAIGVSPLVMLTGDNQGVARAIAADVGVDTFRADLLPEDKVTAIRELVTQHGNVGMVGDGVNDAPALAHATVGIAMGAAGTATALEAADIALMGDDLGQLPFAVGLARQTRAIIRQNLYVSLGVIALLVIATTTGLIGMGPAVFFHEGSTLLVIANALRLLVYTDSTAGMEPVRVATPPTP